MGVYYTVNFYRHAIYALAIHTMFAYALQRTYIYIYASCMYEVRPIRAIFFCHDSICTVALSLRVARSLACGTQAVWRKRGMLRHTDEINYQALYTDVSVLPHWYDPQFRILNRQTKGQRYTQAAACIHISHA